MWASQVFLVLDGLEKSEICILRQNWGLSGAFLMFILGLPILGRRLWRWCTVLIQ